LFQIAQTGGKYFMVKVFVFNVPAAGHVNPTLPVVRELVERGANVTYYLTPGYQKAVEATGATFCPYENIPDNYFEQHKLDGSNPPQTALTLARTSRELLPGLVRLIETEKPDVIVYDSMCPWGWIAAAATNTPAVSSMSLLVMTPAMIMSRFIPLMGVALRNFGALREVQAIGKEIARQYTVKAPGFMDFINYMGEKTVNYTSQMLQPDGDKMSSSIKFVGPSIEPRTDTSGFPFDQLNTKPLIYISLGTVINQNVDFYRQCFAAFKNMDVQVVMSVGKKTDIKSLGDIPQNFIVRNFVPQLEVLQRAALFITHAGMNSVQEGLYYNVPLLLVPQQDEQRFVAQRIEGLGAGVMLHNTTPTSKDLYEVARRVLENAGYRDAATKVGESLRSAGGYPRAADEVLTR
jgi:MGT family glycosyltransferase